MVNIVGIDYGSKLAGTTAIAHLKKDKVQLFQSKKKEDADQFILDKVQLLYPERVFLDAPLSLPGIYREMAGYDNFFYRKSDQTLGAMSPMFLGGLTARAMRLKEAIVRKNITVQEVYPAQLAQRLGLKKLQYKKNVENIGTVTKHLLLKLPFLFDVEMIKNWHQVDALLALYSGWRFLHEEHETFGDSLEGQIIV